MTGPSPAIAPPELEAEWRNLRSGRWVGSARLPFSRDSADALIVRHGGRGVAPY